MDKDGLIEELNDDPAGALARPPTQERPRAHRMAGLPWCAALALVSACTPASDSGSLPPSDTAGTTAVPVATPDSSTRAVLPGLFGLMAGLEADMAGLSRALWRGQLDTVARFARAVADHPTVPAEEAQAIAGVLGPDMAGFKAADDAVHDLAELITEAAAAGDLAAVLDADAQLRAGCVSCHTTFRARLRDALR